MANGTLEHVLAAAVTEAAASVARTPSMLPVLRNAGVVDAGGKGLELLLRGALASVRGEHEPHISLLPHDIALPSLDAIEAEGFGYETVFVIMPRTGERLDIHEIRARLADMGESVLVAGDANAVKIHVHNERPDEVIAYGLSIGSLSRISVENLDRQASAVRERVAEAAQADGAQERSVRNARVIHAKASTNPVVVAVSPGKGWTQVFQTLGVECDRPWRPEREPIGGRARRCHPRHERDGGHRAAEQPQCAPGRQAGRRPHAGRRGRSRAQRGTPPRASPPCSPSSRMWTSKPRRKP